MKRMHRQGFCRVALLMILLLGVAPLSAWGAPAKPLPARPAPVVQADAPARAVTPTQPVQPATAPPPQATPDSSEEYRLGPGDILNITVWGFDEFNLPASNMQGAISGYYIRPDGKFSFPLVGEVTAAEMNVAELTSYLGRVLSEYLVEPKVTINIAKLRTLRIYVLGEVRNPGVFNIERTHTLLDAVGAAGGPTKDAAKKKVYVVRRNNNNQPELVNLLNILVKGDMRQNVNLHDGDAIYLTSSGRLEFSRDIAPLISSLYMINRWDK